MLINGLFSAIMKTGTKTKTKAKHKKVAFSSYFEKQYSGYEFLLRLKGFDVLIVHVHPNLLVPVFYHENKVSIKLLMWCGYAARHIRGLVTFLVDCDREIRGKL